MSILTNRLKEFFARNNRRIKESECTICIGNEGMDLDSFISSLIVAYAEDVVHVVNMRKEVFRSKGEIMFICKKFNIDIDDLIYLERPLGNMNDDIKEMGTYFLVGNETVPLKSKNIKLYLTDHNQPVNELSNCEVSLIIDHHRLENNVENAKRIYIDIDVGSATTLVARYLGRDLSKKNHCVNDPENKDPEKDTLCVAIAKLLLVPIIIDTAHMKRRTSIFDKTEYKRLKKKANLKKKVLKKLRKTIKSERLNDATLPTEIILQKDYKEYRQDSIKFGISTVKYKFDEWIDREGKSVKGIKEGSAMKAIINDFRETLGIDFYLIGCRMNGERHFLAINFPLMEKFAKEQGFEKMSYKGCDFYKVKLEVSRKIIAPKIREFISKMKLGE